MSEESTVESSEQSIDIEIKFPKQGCRRRATYNDRINFLNFMFDVYETVDATSKFDLAKKLTKLYEEEKNVNVSYTWVYCLLRYGIIKHKNGSFTFKYCDEYTVDDLCRNPHNSSKIRFGK